VTEWLFSEQSKLHEKQEIHNMAGGQSHHDLHHNKIKKGPSASTVALAGPPPPR
jgi:hypothetical protein